MATTTGKPTTSKAAKQPKPRAKSTLGVDQRYQLARRASILLKHVSDPTRLQVISILDVGEETVGTLLVRLGQSQTAVSHHLALLRHAGIIAARREGTRQFYHLTETGLKLARVIKSLIVGDTPSEQTARRPTARRLPALTQRPPKASALASARTEGADVPSDGESELDEEAWGRLNRRRMELIFKMSRARLNDPELAEFQRLQAYSLARMQRKFPGPTLVDEQLRRIEEHLRTKGKKTE